MKAQQDPLDGVASLDDHLESVYVSNEAGDVPDAEVTMYRGVLFVVVRLHGGVGGGWR